MKNKQLFDLDNKVVVVSGGYGHLGTGAVNILHDHGAIVFVAGRSLSKFKEKFEEGDRLHFLEFDISSESSIEKAYQHVSKEYGRIDVLVNNAFYGAANNAEEMTFEEWDTGIKGSLSTTFYAIKKAIPHMKSNGGKIINVSSMYGVDVPDLSIYEGMEQYTNPPNYGVGKAGVIHLTKYYATYLSKYNITVNAISPGPFPNNQVQEDTEFIERLKKKTLLKRIGRPEDLHGTLILLSSSASDYITGQNIIIDGGWTV